MMNATVSKKQSLFSKQVRRGLWLVWIAAAVFTAVLLIQLLRNAPFAGQSPAVSERTAAEIAVDTLQAKLQRAPQDAALYADLGLAYLQRARETGEATFYNLAENALTEALDREPEQLNALIGQGTLALARHAFAEALTWGEKAHARYPFAPEPLGIMVDAYVELGRYDEAVATLQKMVDLRPNLAAYSRVSYVRELHGDVDGAIEAMRRAVDAGLPGAENTLWAQVQLGHLYFNKGDFETAERLYREALHHRPDYAYALAGIGKLEAARGEYGPAIATYLPLVERYPVAEFVIFLGDVYTATGQAELAARQYELVRVIQQLNAAAGMDVELELALFEVEHGDDPTAAVDAARAAYERRPSIYAADVLAWAHYHAGEYATARQYSREALRLGTRDARLYYHAGVIAHALGGEAQARVYLQAALDINPAFSLLHAPKAQALLAELQ